MPHEVVGMEWYYALNGQQQGPVSEDDLHGLFKQGVVTVDSLLWKEGMGNWQPYRQVFSVELPASLPPSGVPVAVGPSGTGGQTRNSELRKQAREALSGNWLGSLGILFVMGLALVVSGIIPFAALIVSGPLFLGMHAYFLGVARGQSVEIGLLFRGFDRFADSLVLYLLTMLIYIGVTIVLCIPVGIILFSAAAINGGEPNLDQGLAFLGVFMTVSAFSILAFWMVFTYMHSRIGLAYYFLWDNPQMGGSAALGASWNATRGTTWKLFRMNVFFALVSLLAYMASSTLAWLATLLGETIGAIVMLLFFPLFIVMLMLVAQYMFVSLARYYDDLKTD